MAGLKIGFYDNDLGIRGTALAMYRYAKYNEQVLGNESHIFTGFYGRDMTTKPAFDEAFPGRVTLCHSIYPIDELGLDYLYIIKAGGNEGLMLQNTPCLIHAVFCTNDPHGHRYAYVSDWLAGFMGYSPREQYAVPHICEPLPFTSDNFRAELGIPSTATVFGVYAGATEFNIRDVHVAMDITVAGRKDVYFLLMNIQDGFNGNAHDHPQIIYLPGTSDLYTKSKFVNTCDAMIHARGGGETFGLAVAEFSMANKPVVTYDGSGERCHLEILGEKAILYNNCEEVLDIFNNLKNYIKYDDYNCYRSFNPEAIMDRFQHVFLD